MRLALCKAHCRWHQTWAGRGFHCIKVGRPWRHRICTRSLWLTLVLPGLEARSSGLHSPPCHLSSTPGGPDFSSDKSLAITTKKTQLVSTHSFLFFHRTWRGHLTPARDVQSKCAFKKSGLAATKTHHNQNKQVIKKAKISLVDVYSQFGVFYSPLVIYYDHLSMPKHNYTPSKKKKSPASRLSRKDKCSPCTPSPAQFICYFATRANCFLLFKHLNSVF